MNDIFNQVAAHVHERLTSKKWTLRGWDARDPAGCWTHDRTAQEHGGSVDFGFWMFDTFEDAKVKADTLEFSLIKFETFKHGGEGVSRWTVERFEAFYG